MRDLLKRPFWLFAATALVVLGLGIGAMQFLPDTLFHSFANGPSVLDRTQASTAAIITQRGKLRIGVRRDVYPFGFLDSREQPVGFDIDLAREFARRWLDNADALELVTVSAADQIPRLIAGDVDLLMAAIARRREREALIDFSDPYYADYGIGLPQGDSQLRALVNFTLQDMQADGTYGQIYTQWFPDEEPLALELAPGQAFAQKPAQLSTAPIVLGPSRLVAIQQRGRLLAAVHQDFAPFSTLDSTGQPVGFDIDLVHEFARRWLGDANAIELIPGEPATQIQRLAAGEVDLIAAALVRQREWASQIDFSQTYMRPPVVSLPLTIGLPQNDPSWRALVNETLQALVVDGTYARLFQKWFPGREPPPLELWPGAAYQPLDLIPMGRIAAGEFVRGNGTGFPDERVQQTLALAEFYIDQFEVTNRQYAECVQAAQCALPRLLRSVNFADYYTAPTYANYPVIWVTWQDAHAYCAFRGKRLPTEAEWEKAARGTQGGLYPWGDAQPTEQANFDYVARDTTAVGSFPDDVSSYGVYDMAGNVREWVADWYQWDYYQSAPSTNPPGPETGVTKVLRGGSWNDIAPDTRSTTRRNFLPESFDSNLGFRCASSTFPPAQESLVQ